MWNCTKIVIFPHSEHSTRLEAHISKWVHKISREKELILPNVDFSLFWWDSQLIIKVLCRSQNSLVVSAHLLLIFRHISVLNYALHFIVKFINYFVLDFRPDLRASFSCLFSTSDTVQLLSFAHATARVPQSF